MRPTSAESDRTIKTDGKTNENPDHVSGANVVV